MPAPFDPSRPGQESAAEQVTYVYDDPQVAVAVNVALVTERPLLITGPAGAGKSSLATDVAWRLDRAYLETVITSRTRLSDLVGEVDLVRRLNDAQAERLDPDYGNYLVPGVLWWAFDPASARRAPLAGPERLTRGDRYGTGVVVLLDEIDKAEPDLPNDLLGPLGTGKIAVPHRAEVRTSTPTLVMITSNGERDMPPAFLRRCVHLELADPNKPFLIRVATAHFGPRDDELYQEVAERTLELQADAKAAGRRPPSTAEYLDTVRACIELDVRPRSTAWRRIEEAALGKFRPPQPADA
jgi:MoxR-like ATPase